MPYTWHTAEIRLTKASEGRRVSDALTLLTKLTPTVRLGNRTNSQKLLIPNSRYNSIFGEVFEFLPIGIIIPIYALSSETDTVNFGLVAYETSVKIFNTV